MTKEIMFGRRRFLQTSSALAAVVATPWGLTSAWAANDWKATKPIRLVVPFPAGGTSDILARMVANSLGDRLGQPMIIDNKPGASGSIGSQAVSMAPPDGMTLVVATTDSHSIYPHVYSKQIFVAREQVAVAPLAIIPFALLVRADLPVNTMKEFIEFAKQKQVSYASWGSASAANTAAIMLARATGVTNMLHVPYQGTAPAFQAVMAGQVDAVMGPVLMASTNKTKLKTIAVMAPERVASMSEVPTFAEQGVPLSREGEFWIGIFAPPHTPANIVDALSEAISGVTSQPAYKQKLNELGLVSQVETAEKYNKFYAEDYERWGRLVKESNIKQD